MGQQIAVFVIVALALAYAAWKLLPAALTRRIASALLTRARRAGVASERLARWERRMAVKSCGACDACNGCAPAPAVNSDGRSAIRFERMS